MYPNVIQASSYYLWVAAIQTIITEIEQRLEKWLKSERNMSETIVAWLAVIMIHY